MRAGALIGPSVADRVAPVTQQPRAARPAVTCAATSTTTASPVGNPLLLKAVEMLFTFPPIFNAASRSARKKIVDRGASMGMDFAAEIEAMRSVNWDAEMAAIADPAVVRATPDYYRQPFHAYPKGNLCMEAALEVTVASKSVHATVMDPAGKVIDPEGDNQLRGGYHSCMQQLLQEAGARSVKDILDLGAASGLSSLALMQAFPEAAVTALDLSPHFLAVGRYLQRQREAASGANEALTFVHGLAEDTRLPAESFDLVSICLVCHELPEAASRAIFKEAMRVLRPGGALAIMEMNPSSPVFRRVMENPVPYVVFKSTEPYLLDYMGMDMHAALRDAGFETPRQLENSPRHRSVVARKSNSNE